MKFTYKNYKADKILYSLKFYINFNSHTDNCTSMAFESFS